MSLARYVDHPSGFLALSPRNALFTLAGREGFVAYRRHGRHRLNLGGVQAPAGQREALLDAFLRESRGAGDRVVAVQVRADQVDLFRGRGFAVGQLGTSYALDLRRFSLAGGARLKLRNRIARARRSGVQVVELGADRPLTGEAWRALGHVSREWLGSKGGRELSFMVGELGAPGEPFRRVFIAEGGGRTLGFITYVPAWGERPGHLHDLTRRAPDAPAGVMELINATAVARFMAEGARFLHFGLTPFVVDAAEPPGGHSGLARVVRFLGRHSLVYPSRSQADYKLKWAPDVVERESIAFERMSPAALWALLVVTRSVPWPTGRSGARDPRGGRLASGLKVCS